MAARFRSPPCSPFALRLLSGLVLCALLGLATACSTAQPKPSAPRVEAGVLQLAGHDWSLGPVSLDGDWGFGSGTTPVPGKLNFDGSAWGRGTYRLRLSADPAAGPYALRLPSVNIASVLSVNGTVLRSCGTPGDTAESEVPDYPPGVVVLPDTPDGIWDIGLEFSNHHDIYTGLTSSVLFGPADAIVAERERALAAEAVMFGGLLLLGFYHCASFFFRTRNRAPLWLGILSLMVAFRATLYGELLLQVMIPEVSWFFIIRSVYLTMTLALLAFVHYIANLFPRQINRRVFPPLWVVTAIFGLMDLFAPTTWFTSTLPVFQACMLAGGTYGLFVLGKALRAREAGAGIFLIGLLVFMGCLILDIAKIYLLWSLPSVINAGLVAFMLSQALVVARTFSSTFTKVEEYSASMERLNLSLERFIPREVLGLLGKNDITEIGLGDYSSRRMAVFFLDIRDFTTLSETMTPEQNFRFINSFLKRFGPLVREHGGFVDKYLGDGMMALFPEGPLGAVNAAAAMRHTLVDYNAGRERAGHQPIRFGIGIHAGPLMLGTIGENRRMDSTVISDTVNAASRLEGLTKKFQADVLVSREAIESLPAGHPHRFSFLGAETVKGKTKSIDVYRLETGTDPAG